MKSRALFALSCVALVLSLLPAARATENSREVTREQCSDLRPDEQDRMSVRIFTKRGVYYAEVSDVNGKINGGGLLLKTRVRKAVSEGDAPRGTTTYEAPEPSTTSSFSFLIREGAVEEGDGRPAMNATLTMNLPELGRFERDFNCPNL